MLKRAHIFFQACMYNDIWAVAETNQTTITAIQQKIEAAQYPDVFQEIITLQ